jgi:hypothetical protein
MKTIAKVTRLLLLRRAVSFPSACTTNRFPSPRCASAIQIVRPLESIAETHLQLQPALLKIVGDNFPILHLMPGVLLFVEQHG